MNKMKIILLILLYQFIILEYVHGDPTEIPETISFNIMSGSNEEIQLELVRMKTFLANKNLPVWVEKPRDSTKLTPLRDIMSYFTPFSVYWDTSICAAILYNHELQQLDGTIGQHHIIRGLKYNSKTRIVKPTVDTVFLSPLQQHQKNRLAESENVIIKTGGNQMREFHKSLQKYPDEVYIETLVIIDYMTFKFLKFDYISIVSYVLSVFNSVDMIFSTITKPIIRMNIAGIIVASTVQSLPELSKKSCYKRRPTNHRVVEMDASCVARAIKLTLEQYQAVPLQSYDIVIFFTRYPLFDMESIIDGTGLRTLTKVHLNGVAFSSDSLDGYKLSPDDVGVAIVSHFDVYEHLPIIAHEIAHLLGVPHDEGPLWIEDGTCDAHLMKKDNSYCDKCFRFSGTTPKFLELFFGSRESCIFRNEPRSLKEPPGPRVFWNDDEQCKCYGYTAAYKPLKTALSSIAQFFWPGVDCKIRLECVDENDEIIDTALYMDGTPCDRNRIGNKVCWNTECLPVTKDDKRRCIN